MIIVHEVFICKPGNASKLAKKFKEAMSNLTEFVNVMTDVTGQFNKVVIMTQYENLASYEKHWEEYFANSEEVKRMKEVMEGYTDMYLTGSREIYHVV